MANKLTLDFSLIFLSDGSTTTVAFNAFTGPVGYFAPGGNVGLLADSLAGTISDAINLSGDWSGAAVTKQSILVGVVTLAISPVPTAGERHTISGTLAF